MNFKPSRLRYLLLEAGDTLILRQKGLGYGRLSLLLLILIAQRTITPGSYLRKLLPLNIKRILSTVRRSIGLHYQPVLNTLR